MADTQAGVALLALGPRVSSTLGWSGEGDFESGSCWENGGHKLENSGPGGTVSLNLRFTDASSESPLGQDYVRPDPHTTQPDSQPAVLGAEGLLIARPGHQDALFRAYLCSRLGCGRDLVETCAPTTPPWR